MALKEDEINKQRAKMQQITSQLSELGSIKREIDANIEGIVQKHQGTLDSLEDRIGSVTKEEVKQSRINKLVKQLIAMYEQKYLKVKFANDSFQNDF